jgi:hypothetical protein
MGIHSLAEIEACARSALARKGHAQVADFAAPACTFLEGVGYPGLKQLAEALSDSTTTAVLEKDLMGLDLQDVSCVFLGPEIERLTREHGRLFLRNVRHGLYLLPAALRETTALAARSILRFRWAASARKTLMQKSWRSRNGMVLPLMMPSAFALVSFKKVAHGWPTLRYPRS